MEFTNSACPIFPTTAATPAMPNTDEFEMSETDKIAEHLPTKLANQMERSRPFNLDKRTFTLCLIS